MEAWPDIMKEYIFINDYSGIYFICFILIVSFFFQNLFLSVIFSNYHYNYTKELTNGEIIDKKSELYIDFLKQFKNVQVDYFVGRYPTNILSSYCRLIISSTYFTIFMNIILASNLLETILNSVDTGSFKFTLFLSKSMNYIVIPYAIEAILKIISLGFSNYFYESWNKFDFLIVIAGTVELVIFSLQLKNDVKYLRSLQILRILRVFKIVKTNKLLAYFKNFLALIKAIYWFINNIFQTFILVFVSLSIFSIIGCFIYSDLKYNDQTNDYAFIDSYFNFNNFFHSFLLNFKMATGENWPEIMMEFIGSKEVNVSTVITYLYFILQNFLSQIIIMNFFLMSILQSYDEFNLKECNPTDRFNEYLDDFKSNWNIYCDEIDLGEKMKYYKLPQLINKLRSDNWNFQIFEVKCKFNNTIKMIAELNLYEDNKKCVYFKDCFFKLLKMSFSKDIVKTNYIKNKENAVKRNIIQEISINNNDKTPRRRNSGLKKSLMKQNNSSFLSFIMYKISFKYLNLAVEHCKLDKLIQEI